MRWRTFVFVLPVTALRIQILVPSLWRHKRQRDQLRQNFPRCQVSNVDLEQHFFMGEATTSEAQKEISSHADLVVLPMSEEDLEMQQLTAQRKAEAETSLGLQVLHRPSPAALRLLHSLAWLSKERPDFDMVLKLEDTSEVPLPFLLEQVLMQTKVHNTRDLLLGKIIEDFPLTVPIDVQEACETYEVPVEAERFCLEMIQVSMSGMDMRGCLRVAAECCKGGCTHDTLTSCSLVAREVGMDTVMYFGTAFAPPFPDPAVWGLGRGCVEFITENINDLKVRIDDPEILLGFWLAGLEDMKIVSLPDFS